MDGSTIALLVVAVLLIALIAYAIWRNGRVRVNVKADKTTGQASLELETARTEDVQAARPTPAPTAELKVGNISNSDVANLSSGDATLTARDISASTVKNVAGQGDGAG